MGASVSQYVNFMYGLDPILEWYDNGILTRPDEKVDKQGATRYENEALKENEEMTKRYGIDTSRRQVGGIDV